MQLLSFAVGVLLLLGGTFGFAVILNNISAREEHLKAKIFGVIGFLFGIALIFFILYYLPEVSIQFSFVDFGIIIGAILAALIEVALVTHFDPNHGY